MPKKPQPESAGDIALMARVARRDPEATAIVAERLIDRVRRLSRLLLRDAGHADDAAQLALLEILESARSFGEPGNLEAWADRIVLRTAMRLRRHELRRRNILQQLLDIDALRERITGTPSTPGWGGDVERYLSTLNEERREVFVLHYALGYTVDEISDITAIPTGTVKDRLVTARKRLRQVFAREAKGAHRLERTSQ